MLKIIAKVLLVVALLWLVSGMVAEWPGVAAPPGGQQPAQEQEQNASHTGDYHGKLRVMEVD